MQVRYASEHERHLVEQIRDVIYPGWQAYTSGVRTLNRPPNRGATWPAGDTTTRNLCEKGDWDFWCDRLARQGVTVEGDAVQRVVLLAGAENLLAMRRALRNDTVKISPKETFKQACDEALATIQAHMPDAFTDESDKEHPR